MNWSAVILLLAIFLLIMIKSFQNHRKNKKFRKKKKIFTTKDLAAVLFNSAFIVGGVVTVLIGIGLDGSLFGAEIAIAQSVINILAGILFVWFGVKYLFWGDID